MNLPIDHSVMAKEPDREKLAADIARFLAEGKAITQVERGATGDPTRPAHQVMRTDYAENNRKNAELRKRQHREHERFFRKEDAA